MQDKNHSVAVRKRFIKAMKQIIADEKAGTQKEFAEAVDEFPQNITKIITGVRYPTVETLCKICLVYGIDPGWLLLNKNTMYGNKTFDGGILERLNNIERMVKAGEVNIKKKAS